MDQASITVILAGGVGGSVGAFVGVAVGGSPLDVTLITLGVALVVGLGVIASAAIAGDVEVVVDAE